MNKKKNIIVYVIDVALCLVMVLVHCYMKKAFLFGSNTILLGDAAEQYYFMAAELWQQVHSGNFSMITDTIGMGTDFYCSAFYYLSSPFSILFLLAPLSKLELMLQVIAVAKWVLCGVAMSFYILHTNSFRIHAHRYKIAVVFGLAYGMSRFAMGNIYNFMWMDVLYLFPLLIYAFERMMDQNKWKAYYAVLLLMILCNFYLAFSACIFLVLYCFYRKKETIVALARFVKVSLLSTATAAVVLVPCISMLLTRNTNDDAYAKTMTSGLLDFCKGFYALRELESGKDQVPALYFGVGLLFLFVCSFFVKEKRNSKIKKVIFLLIAIASFCIVPINRIWHGGAVTHTYLHRFSYVFIFWTIWELLHNWRKLRKVKLLYVAMVAVVFVALFVFLFFNETVLYNSQVYLSCIFLFMSTFLVVLFMRRKSIKTNTFVLWVLGITMAELLVNGWFVMSAYRNTSVQMKVDAVDDLAKHMDVKDGTRTVVENMPADIGTVIQTPMASGFTSFSRPELRMGLEDLGVSGFGNDASSTVLGASPLVNQLFGVKYGIGKHAYAFGSMQSVAESKQWELFENQQLGSWGSLCDEDVLSWKLEKEAAFENQNAFAGALGVKDDLFDILSPSDNCFAYFSDVINLGDGYYKYNVKDSSDALNVVYDISEDMDFYINYMISAYAQCYVMVGDDIVYQNEYPQKAGTIEISDAKKGQQIRVIFAYLGALGTDQMLFCRAAKWNPDVYAQLVEQMSKGSIDMDYQAADRIAGDVSCDQDVIWVTPLQPLKGYHVTVDKKAVEPKTVGDMLMAIPLSKGEHTIEITYATPGVVVGAVISVVALVLMIVCCLFERRKSVKK